MKHCFTVVLGCCLCLVFCSYLGVDANPAKASAQSVPPAIQLEPVLSDLSNPLYLSSANDGTNRLFIVERAGRILVLQPGTSIPTVFIDITSWVASDEGEQGMLGFVFHPMKEASRRFLVSYTREPDGATVIAQYRVSATDQNTANPNETVLLVIPQLTAQHHSGMLAFGPDGYLYISVGDSDSGNDPNDFAQNLDELRGKVLRIDVDHTNGAINYAVPPDNPFFGPTAGRDEIYALGFRNPWRFSFDRGTGQLYLADVGQDHNEEIDIISRGGNYGWRVFEGTQCTNLGPASCQTPGFIPPIAEYLHAGGRCAVIGGYVYRGQLSALPTGTYVYGDICTGEILALSAGVQQVLLDTSLGICSFGEDESGEIYVVDLNGTISRITNTSLTCAFGISPSSRSFPANGGTGNLAVAARAGCFWLATSNASFIHITSIAGGSGYGSVGYSVAPNTTPYSRTGTLSVAGRVFTVIQTPVDTDSDTDSDGIPDVVEVQEGTNPTVKDNDVFANTRLFVMQQYRDFLDREGEAQGIAFWSNSINSGSQTRAQVIDSFFNSQEFQGTVAPLTRLYFGAFQRIPDYEGLTFWVNQYRNGATLDSIAQAFAQSPEFQQTYGSLSNSGFVTLLYNNVLGRPPDPGGHAYWTALLVDGIQTRGQVLLGFSESPEYRQTSFNKVYVSLIYIGMLRRAPDQPGFDFWLNQMNSGASRLQLIQGFLSASEYRNRFLP